MRTGNCRVHGCTGQCRKCKRERAARRNQQHIRDLVEAKGLTDEIQSRADEILCQTFAHLGMYEALEAEGFDTVSSASSQCYIETGAYLRKGDNELVDWL